MSRKKKILEPVSGSYAAIPHGILDSKAFTGASHPAKALLLELIRQHNGSRGNNGHLQLTMKWLKPRGWCIDVVSRARAELIERNLIVQTKRGGLGIGPDFFALTWISISDFNGLDVGPRDYHQGAWALPPPERKRRNGQKKAVLSNRAAKKNRHSVEQNKPVLSDRTGDNGAVLPNRTEKAIFGDSPVLSNRDNEYCQVSPGTGEGLVGNAGAVGLAASDGCTKRGGD